MFDSETVLWTVSIVIVAGAVAVMVWLAIEPTEDEE